MNCPTNIAEITRLFGQFTEAKDGKVAVSSEQSSDFGYRKAITVERPLRDEPEKSSLGAKGKQRAPATG